MSDETLEMKVPMAEYVLGTMPYDERKQMEQRLVQNPALRVELRYWEEKLSPLNDLVQPVAPSVDIWKQISDSLFETDIAKAANGSWAPFALVASVLMVAFMGLFTWSMNREAQPFGGDLVAIVETTDKQPGWLVKINLQEQAIAVEALTRQAIPAGKSLELWVLTKEGTPKSLGLLPVDAAQRGIPVNVDMASESSGTLAVSLEPQGGSATGLPTGPVLYTAPVHDNSSGA